MDDEKSITAKLTNVISKAANSVKSVVSHVVETASDAAQHAMEVNAEKISRIPPARIDPAQVAATTNEQVYMPEASDAATMPMPLANQPATKPAKKTAKKTAAGKTRKTAKQSGVRPAKKARRKSDE